MALPLPGREDRHLNPVLRVCRRVGGVPVLGLLSRRVVLAAAMEADLPITNEERVIDSPVSHLAAAFDEA